MSQDLDKFSKFIQENVKNYEVPFEPAHWTEINQKLDTLKPSPGISSGIINKLLWVGAGVTLLAGAWYFYDKSQNKEIEIPVSEEVIVDENSSLNPIPLVEEKKSDSKIESDQKENISNAASASEENHVEMKLEKYAGFSEQQIKEESKNYVEQVVDEQKSSFGDEQKIDNNALKTEIVVDAKTLCEGQDLEFNVNRVIDGASYYWNFGDNGLTSRKQKPTHSFKKAGTYTLTLLVSKGEKNDYKVEKVVVIESAPSAKIEEIEKEITLNHPYVNFEAKTNCNCEFSWTFNDAQKANGQKAEFLVPDKGSYPVNLQITSKNGCKSDISSVFNASKGVKIFVEDAFTPNGNGNNDNFLPKELTVSNVDFTLTVSDKSGQIVFESQDKYTGWNGSLNNTGNILPAGIYLWKLSFKDDYEKLHQQSGTIKLLR